MLWLAAIGVLAGLYLVFAGLEKPRGGGTLSTVDASGNVMVVLEQDRNGHYEAEGTING